LLSECKPGRVYCGEVAITHAKAAVAREAKLEAQIKAAREI
jgi:hypothetical protein